MNLPRPLAYGIATLLGLALHGGLEATSAEIKLMVQRGYLPGNPVLVRVDQVGPPDWDSTANLSVDRAGVTLAPAQVVLRNGRGSAFVTISGAADFTLTATMGSASASRSIRALTNDPVVTVGGTLPGTSTTWGGIVQITSDLTVPAGHTLTILSNTLVLVNGGATAALAPDILVSGSVQSLGSEDYPVTVTCANPGQYWGQIRHNAAQPSLYRYTSISRAGRAATAGHTGAGPAIRTINSGIVFDHCNITDLDLVGKSMYGDSGANSDLTLANCLLSRSRMGPEIQGTALLITNTHFIEFRGTDDADALYVLTQGSGQRVHMIDSVIGFTDDDGLDTYGPTMTIERCIFRNMNSGVDVDGKGISIFNGVTHLRRCLIVDCITSISTKWGGGPAAFVTINECTILGTSNSVVAAFKSNAPGPFIDHRITNSILRSIDPVKSDFGDTNFTIVYCNVSEDWPGTGNQTSPPLFADAYDFHLQAASPCIDAGDPASAPDPDGSLKDIGAFTFIPPAPVLSGPSRNQFILSAFPNRNYVVDYSTNLGVWNELGTFFQTNAANLIQDSSPSAQRKFYRARLAP